MSSASGKLSGRPPPKKFGKRPRDPNAAAQAGRRQGSRGDDGQAGAHHEDQQIHRYPSRPSRPVGRSTSTRIRMAKITTSRCDRTYVPPNSYTRPNTSPPSSAPGILPSPPRTTTLNASTLKAEKPFGAKPLVVESRVPEATANAAPMPNVSAYVRPMSMPFSRPATRPAPR